jgi:hypothetical protein
MNHELKVIHVVSTESITSLAFDQKKSDKKISKQLKVTTVFLKDNLEQDFSHS